MPSAWTPKRATRSAHWMGAPSASSSRVPAWPCASPSTDSAWSTQVGRIVGPAFAGDSQLRVKATPASLLGLAFARLRGDGETAIPPGQVEIAGDAELARRLERLATRFEPDIDEVFARAFGDVIGFQVARGFRRAIGLARRSASALVRDTADYLVEERRDLIAKPEMEQFLDEVDELRERADRFEARFRRLNAAART